MLKLIVLIFAVMVTTLDVAAQALPAFPPGAEAREIRILSTVNPQSRVWIKQEAARRVETNDLSDATAVRASQDHVRGKNLADGMNHDVEALAFLVLMEAARSAREDLKAIMGRVKQVNHAKSKARETASTSRSTASPSKLTQSDSPMAIAKAPAMRSAANQQQPQVQQQIQPQSQLQSQARHPATSRAITQLRPMPRAEFERQLSLHKGDVDSLSDMGEMESLRLQIAMDRMSKMMSTLSNLLKKIADTSSGITKNIK